MPWGVNKFKTSWRAKSVWVAATPRERKKPGPKQKELFKPPPDPLVAELRALDVDGLSPRAGIATLRVAKARALLHQAGITPPLELTMKLPPTPWRIVPLTRPTVGAAPT